MKWIVITIGLVGTVVCADAFGANPPYAQLLSINFSAPNLEAYLSDTAGNRTGIDPSAVLDSVGRQIVNGIEAPNGLQEIPGSASDQSNIEGQSTTGWEIDIENPSDTYVLNYTSIYLAAADAVSIDLQSYSPRKLTPFNIYLLAQKNVYKQLQISVSLAGITITPTINSGDFLRDTQSACALEDISPPEACEALEDLAAEVEKSISGGDARKEASELNLYLFVLNLLHNWGSSGSLQNWRNLAGCPECVPLFKKGTHGVNFFAKDPAYSALVLDAQTLLNALPNQGTSQGGGNQDGSDQGGGNHGGGNEGGGNQGESNHRRGDN